MTIKYKNILLAVELDEAADLLIIEKAKEIQSQFNSKIILLHAIEHFSNYGAAYGVAAGIDIAEILAKEAQQSMAKLSKKLKVPSEQCVIKVGSASQIILEEAEQHNIDLIIIGSHGRHGLRLLLGSTANAVLHGAKCDVLAVRLKDGK